MEEYGVFNNECVSVSNAIRALQSEHIIIVGCHPDIVSELTRRINSGNVIELNSFSENFISKIPGYKKITDSEKLEKISPQNPPSGHIIAVEDNGDLSLTIARNLAAFTDANIVLIPRATKEEVEEVQEYLRSWISGISSLEREDGKNILFSIIEQRLGKLICHPVESISFITRGIPYGIYPFTCPTTHYFSVPSLGLSIIKGMLKSNYYYLRCPIVYLCDPGEFDESEFKVLSDIFFTRGYTIRRSYGSSALVRDVRFLTQYLPSDFIFYSTHCGELEGRRVKERFITSDGKEHIVCYEAAMGYSPVPNSDLFEVLEFKRWLSLDDVRWSDNEGKNKIGAGEIIKEYIDLSRREKGKITLLESSAAGIIKGASALKMYESNFLPALTSVGGLKYPIVFNNACSSWREFSERFSWAGASIYIGASVDIPNLIALDVVTKFARAAVNGKAIGYCLYNAQKEFVADLHYTPYLMYGYLFTKCPPTEPRKQNPKIIAKELSGAILKWKEHAEKTEIEEVRKNSIEVAAYLQDELEAFLK